MKIEFMAFWVVAICSVVIWFDTNFSVDRAASIFTSLKSRKLRQLGPPKRRYPTTTLPEATTQKTMLAYLFTPWCWILFEKLIVIQLVKKYPAFL
jgi:hypothetical protein